MTIVRTALISIFAAALTFSSAQAAEEPRKVVWEDLRPKAGLELPKPLDLDGDGELTDSEMAKAPKASAASDAIVPELNGKLVRIPAFVVPLDGDAKALTELLLVPYFGACVHVPPPPPNQIIHVTAEGKGIEVGDLDIYDPVYATGVLNTDPVDHDIAEIGYRMTIKKLEPYSED